MQQLRQIFIPGKCGASHTEMFPVEINRPIQRVRQADHTVGMPSRPYSGYAKQTIQWVCQADHTAQQRGVWESNWYTQS